MTDWAAVIGIGNEYRRDDGVGPVVIGNLRGLVPAGVRLVASDGEPTHLLDAWAGMTLAVVVVDVVCDPPSPGRIHRTDGSKYHPRAGYNTHALGVPDAIRLAEVLHRAPRQLVVYAVEAADVGVGVGLSAPVAGAVPDVIRTVRADLNRRGRGDAI